MVTLDPADKRAMVVLSKSLIEHNLHVETTVAGKSKAIVTKKFGI